MAKPPFCMNLSPLSEEGKQIAEKELRETPDVVKPAIEQLRKLLQADPKIHYRDDDDFLIIFLRPCKFYPESAYELMKRIAEFRKKNEHLLKDLIPKDEEVALTQHNVVNVLTNVDQKGRRVLFVNCGGSWDPSKVTADQLFRIFFLIHECAFLEPETQVRGVVVVMDFDGMSLKQVKAMSPAFSMRLLGFIQDALPLRLKEIHMVKQPFVFNMVWSLFKPFIREKLKTRIFFHGSKMESLHKYLDPSCLPKNYGGALPEFNYTGADWYPCLMDNEKHIKEMNSYGLVEK